MEREASYPLVFLVHEDERMQSIRPAGIRVADMGRDVVLSREAESVPLLKCLL